MIQNIQEKVKTFLLLAAKIGTSIRRIATEELSDLQMPVQHLICLYFVHKNPSLLSKKQSDFCEEDLLLIASSVGFLTENGYITEKGDQKLLSEKGESLAETLSPRIDRVLNAACEGLYSEDRIIFESVLGQIASNLENVCREYQA